MRAPIRVLLISAILGISVPALAGEQQRAGEAWPGENEIWYEPDFNRYAIDRGWFDQGEQYGYHYEEEDEFGWYDDDFNRGVEDPEYDAWYGDADEDWDEGWFGG